ncbi:MAG: zinc-ribbon domain-containing protein [Polyangiaceae bacterium]|nr:zinc-ribbon domain-containing protein [Polyangiaceae bacterium]MCB9605007.1 zinc-ribbon domain-containing protein [Polyangiaceae bacterium]
MNVACEKCSAKYAVPDSKVKGRKVRITCKRCGAPIVVDGRALAGDKSAEKPSPAKAAAKPAAKIEPAKPQAAAAKPKAESVKPADAPKPAASAKPIRPETPPTAIATAVSKPPTAKSTMLGGLSAPSGPSPAAPKPLTGLGPKPAQRTMLGGVTAPRPATPIASKAAVKQTLMGGLSPAFGAAPAPRDAGPTASSAAEGEREWTVAVTDEDHYEMNTDEVVQAFAQGNIDEETFIWKEGMDDWLTPFEVPGIAAALRKAGQRPKGENPMAFDDATRVGPSPMDKKPVVAPTPKPGETQGVWKEPGDWKPMAAPGMDLAFDDVTVAMAAPQSRQLLEETRDLIAAKQQDDDEDLTIQGESPLLEQIRAEARLKEGLKTVPPPAPAVGTPYAPPPVEPKIPTAPVPGPSASPTPAPSVSPVPSPVASPVPSPASPGAPRVTASAPVAEQDPVSVAADSGASDAVGPDALAPESGMPVSVEVDGVDDLLGGDTSKPRDDAGDESKTGERNETSVLFSLDAIGPNAGQPKPKPAKMKSTLLGMAPPPPPRPAHLSNPGIEAGDAGLSEDVAVGISASSPDLGSSSSPDLGAAPGLGSSPDLSGGLSSPDLSASPGLSSGPELTAPLDGPDPMLSPPVSAGPVSDFSPPKKSGGGLWVALLLLLLLLGGGAAYAYTQGLGPFAKPVSTSAPANTGSLAPAGQPTNEPTPTAEPADTAPPSDSASDSASAAPTDSPPPAAGTAQKLQTKPDEKTDEKANEKTEEKPDEKTDEKANEKTEEKPDEKAEEKPDTAGAPFDEVAARNALASAAGSASSCKKADGPTGQGRAIVTFAPSGRVTSAVITGAFAGTTVGGCIARVFRGATVPAFSGGPKTVSKTFSVE